MGRTPCCEKDGLKRGPWTAEEDQKLIHYIHKHGYGNWRTLPANAGLQRCGKSCRLRWTNYLRPDIKRGNFSAEEEQTIIQLHSILGNKWSAIAARLPGRTDNEIKNYWNTHIRKTLLRMGIDPVTHTPRLDLLNLSSIFNAAPTFYDSSNLNLFQQQQQQQLGNSLLQDDLTFQNSNMMRNAGGPWTGDEAQNLQQPNGGFGLGNCCPVEDYDLLLQSFGGCYEPVEQLMDPAPLDESRNFSLEQVWSTPSSSQVNSCSTVTTTEDEREISYCSNLFNFDASNVFYVNDFM